MFISVVFPVADFRGLHPEAVGRLDKPRWGEQDPQANFARGFGAIHYRSKSGIGLIGENYYADCENLVRYPNQTFVSAIDQQDRPILAYPIYRRFYFDGQMSGRFEFGFRLNEASIYDVEYKSQYTKTIYSFDYARVISQIFQKNILVKLPDGRLEECELYRSSLSLRDSYLTSSTRNKQANQYDISTVSSEYVSVGKPFAFLRSGNETPLSFSKEFRSLISGSYKFLGARSGLQGREIDVAIIDSKESIANETANERFARLMYTQLRALAFAHSFYLRQVDSGKFSGKSPLKPAVSAMLDRLSNLVPLEDNTQDADICRTMTDLVKNSDIDPSKMAEEINQRLKTTWHRRLASWLLRNVDRKTDVAIEAAASTATRYALTGSP